MIYSTATVRVNPEGEAPLTRSQIWRGLELKARDARLFLPPGACTSCEVVSDHADFIVREAVILGQKIREIIAFDREKKVSFFQAAGPREGVIVNELFEGDDGVLYLKFYCYLGLRDMAPGCPEEQLEQAQMDSEDRGYRAALLSTLVRTRSLAAESKL